jgi:hypothetical protein
MGFPGFGAGGGVLPGPCPGAGTVDGGGFGTSAMMFEAWAPPKVSMVIAITNRDLMIEILEFIEPSLFPKEIAGCSEFQSQKPIYDWQCRRSTLSDEFVKGLNCREISRGILAWRGNLPQRFFEIFF